MSKQGMILNSSTGWLQHNLLTSDLELFIKAGNMPLTVERDRRFLSEASTVSSNIEPESEILLIFTTRYEQRGRKTGITEWVFIKTGYCRNQ